MGDLSCPSRPGVFIGKRQNQRDGSLRLSPISLALKMAEGAMSRGMWVASRSWKGKSRKEYSPADTLMLAETQLGLLSLHNGKVIYLSYFNPQSL